MPSPPGLSSSSSSNKVERDYWTQKSLAESYKALWVIRHAGGALATKTGVARVIVDFLRHGGVGKSVLHHALSGHPLVPILRAFFFVRPLREVLETTTSAHPGLPPLRQIFRQLEDVEDVIDLEPLLATLKPIEGWQGPQRNLLREPADWRELMEGLVQQLDIPELHQVLFQSCQHFEEAEGCCPPRPGDRCWLEYTPRKDGAVKVFETIQEFVEHQALPGYRDTGWDDARCPVCNTLRPDSNHSIHRWTQIAADARVLHIYCPHRLDFDILEIVFDGSGPFQDTLHIPGFCVTDGQPRTFRLQIVTFFGFLEEEPAAASADPGAPKIGKFGTMTRGDLGWWLHYAPETFEDGLLRGQLVPWEKVERVHEQVHSLIYELVDLPS